MFPEFSLEFADIFISEHEAAMAEAAEKAPSLSRHRSYNVSAVGNNARAQTYRGIGGALGTLYAV
jgi:hypothetical protein